MLGKQINFKTKCNRRVMTFPWDNCYEAQGPRFDKKVMNHAWNYTVDQKCRYAL